MQSSLLISVSEYEGVKKCPLNQYTCDDGSCIHLSNVCDDQKHCKDGSDEHSECGKVILTIRQACCNVLQLLYFESKSNKFPTFLLKPRPETSCI